jgi:hypothetical protein
LVVEEKSQTDFLFARIQKQTPKKVKSGADLAHSARLSVDCSLAVHQPIISHALEVSTLEVAGVPMSRLKSQSTEPLSCSVNRNLTYTKT